MSKTRQASERGFTLIEMLVVLAILTLLFGIVFAALGPAREKGRQAVCISNLRQIYKFIQMYRQDYGEGVEEGRYFQMGLPPNQFILLHYMGWNDWNKPHPLWNCPNRVPDGTESDRKAALRSYWYTVCDNVWHKKDGRVRPCYINPFKGTVERDFPDAVRERGIEYPLIIDRHHPDPYAFDRGRKFYPIVLRLGGQINGRWITKYYLQRWEY